MLYERKKLIDLNVRQHEDLQNEKLKTNGALNKLEMIKIKQRLKQRGGKSERNEIDQSYRVFTSELQTSF